MPRHCSAGGCKSRDNRETRNAGITFHKLPKGATRRNLWITNSHRADYWDPQTDFVYFCSKHFTPESFELTGCSGIRRLKEDAFPTIFESSSTTKCKRPGTLQKREDVPVRKNPGSGNQKNPQQEADMGQTSEEPTVQTSATADVEANENIPAPSQEPSGVEQLSQQKRSPSPPSRPLSPSRYMRRLPPPPGFYLSKEHSYAQLFPLLWRRRFDQAIDCLEKALRQLHAARRRENRLRSTVLRLRDKRLKQALLVSDGCKNRGSWTLGGEKGRGKGGSNQEECETDGKAEDTGVFEDSCVDQIEMEGHFLQDTNSWSERHRGYCFYCGRGQVQVGGQVARRVSKSVKDDQPIMHEDSVETSFCSTAENVNDIQVVSLERRPWKNVETSDSDATKSQVLLQTEGLQHVIPAGVTLPVIHEQSLQFLGSQQNLLLSDTCEGDTEATGQEHHPNLQQHLFWVQGSAEGQVILVPASAEEGQKNILKMEGVAVEARTILVSQADFKGDLGHMTENSGGLSRGETACDGDHSDQHSAHNTASAMRENVREKLKEHLEGFHLQLSTEFIN